ncbi:unnamed protein product, partial [Scytosiphon promiscuus]
ARPSRTRCGTRGIRAVDCCCRNLVLVHLSRIVFVISLSFLGGRFLQNFMSGACCHVFCLLVCRGVLVAREKKDDIGCDSTLIERWKDKHPAVSCAKKKQTRVTPPCPVFERNTEQHRRNTSLVIASPKLLRERIYIYRQRK